MESRENQSASGAPDSIHRSGTSGLRVLILQHPREAKRSHGTAGIVTSCYPHARITKGLGWANLKKAWKTSKTTKEEDIGTRWGVLYLSGRGDAAKLANQEAGVFEFTKNKELRPLPAGLDGVVLLDGNWKEAKTLWWRNAWLLRLKRLVLVEEPASAIRPRRSAQKAALSTAECVAYCLKYVSQDPAASEAILAGFQKQTTSPGTEASPKP